MSYGENISMIWYTVFKDEVERLGESEKASTAVDISCRFKKSNTPCIYGPRLTFEWPPFGLPQVGAFGSGQSGMSSA